MKEIIKIYVELLDEGTPVWRPVDAEPQEDGTFFICEQVIPAYEQWNFLPGERVVVEEQERSGHKVLVAMNLAETQSVEAIGL